MTLWPNQQIVELTDAEAVAIDHYLGIAGIGQGMLEVTRQREEEAKHLQRRRDEAIRRDELTRKVKADRLAAIQAAIRGKAGRSQVPPV